MGLTGAMSMTYVQLVGSDLNGPTTGAIKGACDHVEMGNLTELLAKIQPAIYQETLTEETGQRNSANASFVDRSYILEQMIEKGEIAIIGAKHDLESGAVEFFDETMIACQADVRENMRY
jgi:carbonic anhydrase